jgi:methionyl-tRNA synthetase
MCAKYFEGNLGNADAVDLTAWRRGLEMTSLVGELRELMIAFDYATALQRIWLEVVDAANRYIQETEPFKLAKTDLEACRAVLLNLAEWLRVAAILIKPFLPGTAGTFYRAFNYEEGKAWEHVSYSDAASPIKGLELRLIAPLTSGKPAPLFPKVIV